MMGSIGKRTQIDDAAGGVADTFAKHCFSAFINQRFDARNIIFIGKPHLNTLTRQRVSKQVVGTAIQLANRHDVIARFGDGLNSIGDCGHP